LYFLGKPEHVNRNDIDYVPSLFAFTSTPEKRMAHKAVERAKRWQSRCYRGRGVFRTHTPLPIHTTVQPTLLIVVWLSITFNYGVHILSTRCVRYCINISVLIFNCWGSTCIGVHYMCDYGCPA